MLTLATDQFENGAASLLPFENKKDSDEVLNYIHEAKKSKR